MAAEECKYIWRCAKCGCHFANIIKTEGMIKQEKKCPKCKALNTLTLTPKEIYIHSKNLNGDTNTYQDEYEEGYSYHQK